MPNDINHIGYAARTGPRLRYDGDNRECNLEFSATLGAELLELLSAPSPHRVTPALDELHLVLSDMMS